MVDVERWECLESNARQQYATHAFFRYFGKLPPTVTRRILQESRPYLANGPGIDVACGSGTTLVEAALLGLPVEGLDINPLSVLTSRVKTDPPERAAFEDEWQQFARHSQKALRAAEEKGLNPDQQRHIPTFPRRDTWFTQASQRDLAVILDALRRVETEQVRDFLTVAFAGIVRRVSNASERAGRIFKETGKVPPRPWPLLEKRACGMARAAWEYTAQVNGRRPQVRVMDARSTQLPAARFGLVFFHPPYFALYKYSSDVLRFELEWLRFDRRQIARGEIRDGFKTTRARDVDDYLEDLGRVLAEGRRIVHPRGAMVVISNDSTLRKERLPIIAGILERAESGGFRVVRHCVREVRFAQASYHRSADAEIRTPRDHILFLTPG